MGRFWRCGGIGAVLFPLATSPGAVTLVCVPYAGARPEVFIPLARAFADLNVLAVQLPGHGQRMRERPLTSMAEIVEGLAPALNKAVGGKFSSPPSRRSVPRPSPSNTRS
jgi:hypothetical protein